MLSLHLHLVLPVCPCEVDLTLGGDERPTKNPPKKLGRGTHEISPRRVGKEDTYIGHR